MLELWAWDYHIQLRIRKLKTHTQNTSVSLEYMEIHGMLWFVMCFLLFSSVCDKHFSR